MASAHPTDPVVTASEVTLFPADDGHALPLAAWLNLVARDEPVHLPRPAAEYLAEARAAGEV